MGTSDYEKVIVVEGKSDRKKIEAIINEPIEIICTNGTIGISKLDELIDEIVCKDVYIMVDTDTAGEKLRKQFKRELPEAVHLYVDKIYREVASAPDHHVATILLSANIDVNSKYL
ncbi:hypothetical protein EJF36_17215 [Bacillus sp. HMF5848]|uniref:toprim domain-containing protein n=1 Tax=Bacillus sp. HMF5848 TaxID=2495421 RepID=UPI000F796295|nr:toprim domain-containing protein [Bacillus sp. HMF5848]RSK28467.1 hypothetical protein EJF36_17215 [Bacillus sp. HMF5848]